jgi:hypothetical protein
MVFSIQDSFNKNWPLYEAGGSNFVPKNLRDSHASKVTIVLLKTKQRI